MRRIGEARVHGGCSHQFTGSYLARGMLGGEAELHILYEEIFAYVKDIFVHPVSYFEAEKIGKIGFLPT